MLLTYTPEGADERTWVYDPSKLMSSEAAAIEKVTEQTYAEFGVALMKGSAGCRRALLWVLLKREEPTLRIAQVDPPTGSLTLEFEAHELISMRDQVAKSSSLNDDERATALSGLDELIGDATPAPKAKPSADETSG